MFKCKRTYVRKQIRKWIYCKCMVLIKCVYWRINVVFCKFVVEVFKFEFMLDMYFNVLINYIDIDL